jgi:hypothetical protein
MRRTLLALFITPLIGAGAARAVEPHKAKASQKAVPVVVDVQDIPEMPELNVQIEMPELDLQLPLIVAGPDSPSAPVAPLPPLPPLPPMPGTSGAATTQTVSVKGPVTLRVDGIAIDLEIVAGNPKQVKAQLDGSGGVQLNQRDNRVDVSFAGSSGWPRIPGGLDGTLRVEVPPGSNVELSTASGDIHVRDTGGNVRVRSASGDLSVKHASGVEAMLVSGGARLEDISGDVRLRTVSGDAEVRQNGGSVLEFGTTSGDLDWKGNCAAGCRIAARSTSGDVRLGLPASSSWDLRYVTHSGDFGDDLKAQKIDQRDNGSVHARYGKGEGCIEVQTFSGDLQINKR